MGDKANPQNIDVSLLKLLQQTFQKEAKELIDIYIIDAQKKIIALNKAFHEKNWMHFMSQIQELRLRSVDVGAVPFSYTCITLEIAAQEMRLDKLPHLISMLEKKFILLLEELEFLKTRSNL